MGRLHRKLMRSSGGLFLILLGSVFLLSLDSHAAGIGNSAFDDRNFYECVVRQFDALNPGVLETVTYETVLSDTQLASVSALNCNHGSLPLKDEVDLPSQYMAEEPISSTAGLEKMTGLRTLLIGGHSNLTNINISQNTLLERAVLWRNNLGSLDLAGLSLLQTVDVRENHLTSLDTTSQRDLLKLWLNGNELRTLDLSNNTKLRSLAISNNDISQIDLSMLSELVWLEANDAVSVKPYVEYAVTGDCKLTAKLKFVDYVAAAGLEKSDNYKFDLETHTMTFESLPAGNTITITDPVYDDEGMRDYKINFGSQLETEYLKVDECRGGGINDPNEPGIDGPEAPNGSSIKTPNTGSSLAGETSAFVVGVSVFVVAAVATIVLVGIYICIRCRSRIGFDE